MGRIETFTKGNAMDLHDLIIEVLVYIPTMLLSADIRKCHSFDSNGKIFYATMDVRFDWRDITKNKYQLYSFHRYQQVDAMQAFLDRERALANGR